LTLKIQGKSASVIADTGGRDGTDSNIGAQSIPTRWPQASDYVETQLAERMDRPQLVGDLVTNWHKYGERRKTVALSRLASRTRSTSRMNLSIRRSGRKHRRHDTKGRAGPQHMPRLQNSGISRLGINGSLRSKMCLSNARRRPRATFNGLTRSRPRWKRLRAGPKANTRAHSMIIGSRKWRRASPRSRPRRCRRQWVSSTSLNMLSSCRAQLAVRGKCLWSRRLLQLRR
jgi:hypothetical protein